jgi:NTE family protein
VLIRILLIPLLVLLGSCSWRPAGHDVPPPSEQAIVPLRAERPLVALVLGSGGARGFAHIGVIKALEDAGIRADIVTGASSGAIVAALHAGGHSGRELEEIALGLQEGDLVDVTVFGSGWVLGEALQEFVNRMVDGRAIERLPRPFAAVATEARTGRMVVFNRGNTGLAVRASASVPRVFVAPVINGEEYIDGGISSPVPVKIARAMGADIVIAVDVSWFAQAREASQGDLARYGRSGRYALLTEELEGADIVIVPRTVRTRMLDFTQKAANIAAGEAAGREAAQKVRDLIERATASKARLPKAQVTRQKAQGLTLNLEP